MNKCNLFNPIRRLVHWNIRDACTPVEVRPELTPRDTETGGVMHAGAEQHPCVLSAREGHEKDLASAPTQ